jgi:hypothetical protein
MTLVLLSVAGTLVSGCIGGFGLTSKLYNWNIGLGDKWAAEGVFLVTGAILPVYGVAVLVDGVVLNSVEFWTGVNPVTNKKAVVKAGDSRTLRAEDGSVATLVYRPDGAIDIEVKTADGSARDFTLVRNTDTILAVDESGKVLARVDSEGRLTR